MDGYLWSWPSYVVSSHTHFVSIHPHLTHCTFYVILFFQVSENKLTLTCSAFTGTINLSPVHNVIHVHLIFVSYRIFSFSSHLFLRSMIDWLIDWLIVYWKIEMKCHRLFSYIVIRGAPDRTFWYPTGAEAELRCNPNGNLPYYCGVDWLID